MIIRINVTDNFNYSRKVWRLVTFSKVCCSMLYFCSEYVEPVGNVRYIHEYRFPQEYSDLNYLVLICHHCSQFHCLDHGEFYIICVYNTTVTQKYPQTLIHFTKPIRCSIHQRFPNVWLTEIQVSRGEREKNNFISDENKYLDNIKIGIKRGNSYWKHEGISGWKTNKHTKT